MTSYAEINRQRRQARTLYLELRALDLSLEVVPEDAVRGYRVEVDGFRSLSPAHADRLRHRVEENAPGLARILDGGRWVPDLQAIYAEGGIVRSLFALGLTGCSGHNEGGSA